MAGDGPPGTSVDMALRVIAAHADALGCDQCREALPRDPDNRARVWWCPTAEWALWVLITDRAVPVEMRHAVTMVARWVLLAHWPREVDGCRPCGSPDCGRIQLAGTWLEVVGDHFLPAGVRPAPSPEELHRITGL